MKKMKKRDMFSLRYNLKDTSKIQKDGLDQDTRNKLWNILDLYLNELFRTLGSSTRNKFFRDLFDKVFAAKVSHEIDFYQLVIKLSRDIDEIEWYKIFDLIEYIYSSFPSYFERIPIENLCPKDFVERINGVLEEQNTAYRFVNSRISPITSNNEIKEIEAAINQSNMKPGISEHLKKAFELYSDRKKPDYPNSIKESISAVEALCRAITGSEATLGDALKSIQKSGQIELHPTLSQAFNKLYGYTCDADGIRHGMIDISKCTSEDARFFLVTCSAFVNYLKVKADKAGIRIN